MLTKVVLQVFCRIYSPLILINNSGTPVQQECPIIQNLHTCGVRYYRVYTNVCKLLFATTGKANAKYCKYKEIVSNFHQC